MGKEDLETVAAEIGIPIVVANDRGVVKKE